MKWIIAFGLQRMSEIKSYKTVWTMRHKISKAMTYRDVRYAPGRMVETDDGFFRPK